MKSMEMTIDIRFYQIILKNVFISKNSNLREENGAGVKAG